VSLRGYVRESHMLGKRVPGQTRLHVVDRTWGVNPTLTGLCLHSGRGGCAELMREKTAEVLKLVDG